MHYKQWRILIWQSVLTEWYNAALCKLPLDLTSQDPPLILWHPKAHWRVYKYPPLVTSSNRINPVQDFPSYFFKVYFNIITYLGLFLLSASYHWVFPPKSLMHLSSPSCMLYAPPISFFLTWSWSSLCYYLQPPLTSCSLPQYILQFAFLEHARVVLLL